MTLYIYTKAEIVFMTKSFLFHLYNTRVFMTKSFLLYKDFFTQKNSPTKIIMKLLTNKTTDRHRYVPPVMGGGCHTLVAECLG